MVYLSNAFSDYMDTWVSANHNARLYKKDFFFHVCDVFMHAHAYFFFSMFLLKCAWSCKMTGSWNFCGVMVLLYLFPFNEGQGNNVTVWLILQYN